MKTGAIAYTAMVLAIPALVAAEQNYYPGAYCAPTWGESTTGDRGPEGHLFSNNTTDREDFTCPFWSTELADSGGVDPASEYNVRLIDDSTLEAATCRAWGCTGRGGCQISALAHTGGTAANGTASNVAATGSFQLSWSVNWTGNAHIKNAVWCELPRKQSGRGVNKLLFYRQVID